MAKAVREAKEAIGYLRTSSATNVGPDKDSENRQREAIERFATRAGFSVVAWFYDAAVSGADAIDSRPGFAAALERIASNGVRTIIVETANRFARDLIIAETGYRLLRDQGIELIAADSPTAFLDDTPSAALIRQVLGAVAQFEKAALVAKLKGARDRKRRETGKVEGRKRRVERLDADGAAKLAAAVREAKRLRRASPKTGDRMSYREIAAKLEEAGYLNEAGRRYNPASVKRMLEGGLETAPIAND
jgi:DNA invertase Pin-like site-specific DNA recombinase